MKRIVRRFVCAVVVPCVVASLGIVKAGAQQPVIPTVGCDATCVTVSPPSPPPPPPSIPGVGCDATCTPVMLPPVIITAPGPTIGPASPYGPSWGAGSAACQGAADRAGFYCELDFLLGADGSMCEAFMDMMDDACSAQD